MEVKRLDKSKRDDDGVEELRGYIGDGKMFEKEHVYQNILESFEKDN